MGRLRVAGFTLRGLAVRVFVVSLVLTGLTIAAGCSDEQAANRRQASEHFAEVMALISQSDQGFVPQGQETQVRRQVGPQEVTRTTADAVAFRQSMLSEAAKKLESIVDKGSVSLQESARRTLADVYASQARHTARQARMRWAELSDRSAVLMSYLGSVDRADSLARLLDVDVGQLLARLEEDRAATQGRIDWLTRQQQDLRQRTAQLTKEIQRFNTDSQRHAQEAQRLRDQALLATEGPGQYDLYDESAVADRRANVASAQSQQMNVELDVIESELVLLAQQARLAQEAVETADKQITTVGQRQARLLHQEALASKAQAIERLSEFLDDVVDAYAQGVELKMDRATERMNDAVDELTTVVSVALQEDKNRVQLERLAHMAGLIHVLTDHILVAGSHGHTLAVVASQAPRLMPQQADQCLDRAQSVYEKQKKLIETAKQIIGDATAIYDELAGGNGAGQSELAKQQSERLRAYGNRINQHRLVAPSG